MKHHIFYYIKRIAALTLFISVIPGCKKYLDKKPDKSLFVPTSLEDASRLLDFYDIMNNQYPFIGAISDDDFYILDDIYNQIQIQEKNDYIWAKEAINDDEWTKLYQIVGTANVALETTNKIQPDANNISEFNRIKGSGLFYRAYAFHQIVQYYAEPYDKLTSSQILGIPLRLTPDVSTTSVRSTLEETYNQIITDLIDASKILPVQNQPVSRPNRVAAFAALARVYLTMNEYLLAKQYADSCLSLYSSLMDYKGVDPNSFEPFQRFNQEVIFQAVNIGAAITLPFIGIVDSLLLKSYDSSDLRKQIFFFEIAPGMFGFKGNYDGTSEGSNFSGLAVDEIYLIRSECYARLGDMMKAIDDLNTLLSTRWATGTFTPYTATTAEHALQLILIERRKELIGRGLRWFDLRRLNKETSQSKTLTRIVNGQQYSLPPNDLRYTFLLPKQVIDLTGVPQNNR